MSGSLFDKIGASFDKYAGLTDCQKSALTAMLNGRNVFLTGDAGTGKSFVLQRFLDCAKKNIIACAPTGIAALKLRGGSTIHRAFHLPYRQVYDYSKTIHPPEEILNAQTIVIDEISMCRVDLFDYIAEMIFKAEKMTGRRKQLIVVGDFFQLPPVLRREDREVLTNKYPNLGDGFCFNGANWGFFNFQTFKLDEVIRQSENVFISMLDRARVGDASCLEYFNDQVIYDEPDPEAIFLVPTNAKADRINKMRLAELAGDEYVFTATKEGTVNKGDEAADLELVLKPGARVIALCNEDNFRNGQIGTVKKIDDRSVKVLWDNKQKSEVHFHEWEITRPIWNGETIEHDTIGTFKQIPLRLAYAITIHKSQGQTYEKAIVDPSCFDVGQLYVALSRCESIDGLALTQRIWPNALKSSLEVVDFYSQASDDDADGITAGQVALFD